MQRRSIDPHELANAAVEHITALAGRGADTALVERETAALIAGWIELPGSIAAMGLLRDRLEAVAADTVLRRQGRPLGEQKARADERMLACLEAAHQAAQATIATL